jgi:hypothetical protein
MNTPPFSHSLTLIPFLVCGTANLSGEIHDRNLSEPIASFRLSLITPFNFRIGSFAEKE